MKQNVVYVAPSCHIVHISHNRLLILVVVVVMVMVLEVAMILVLKQHEQQVLREFPSAKTHEKRQKVRTESY